MYQKLPVILVILLSAMLIGLVGHGYELFEKVEGGGFVGYAKALGFPLALEVGNAAGLYVLSSRFTKGNWTKAIAGTIGVICMAFSFLLQYNYYRLKIDFDLLYSFALPLVAALIAVLVGLLDRDNSEPQETINPSTVADNQLLEELKAALKRMADTQTDHSTTLQNMEAGVKEGFNRLWDKVLEVDAREPVIIQQLTEPAKVEVTNPSLTTDERRSEIAKLLQGGDTLNKSSLARQYGVSIPTINNDLAWIGKAEQ